MYEGSALLASGRYEEALARYQAAADVFRAGDNRRQEYEVMMMLGATRFNLDQLAEADTALDRALELGKVIHADQPVQLAFATTMRGMVAGDRGDAVAALAHCREAVALAELGGEDFPDLPFALPCLSRALRLGARAAEALPHAERAVRTADRLGNRGHRYQARLELANVLVALGRDRRRRAALVREALALEDDPERRAAIEKHFGADLR
jgi:tetratricopeptide (TPR) repeat protein